MAEHMGLTAQSLRNQLHRIYRKRGTHDRLTTITHAQRRGLM
ncbi:MAG: hypothetical protein ACRD2D_03935 [Terriglobales bacterium]